MSLTVNPTSFQPAKGQNSRLMPIAIIGIGCRFPGDANTPEAFWKLLCDGTDAIGEIAPGRIDEKYYDSTPATPGKIVTRQGGFLKQIDRFDAAFFGISPREAAAIDPQQRLLLEVVWEAIEDAGIAQQNLAGSRTGVFVGMWTNEYEDAMYAASDNIDLYVTTGGGRYSASGRISYVLNVQGPSLTVDTACSSSLVAVHLACQSLRSGESTMAVAGGVNLILAPQISIGYSRSRMLSPDARCKFGDARANGYVRSEGAGVVLLKPLDQALADGDPIYATILGSAVNNDGHSSGLLVAPSGQGQTAMLNDAYRQAGVTPGDVHYVEAHGTGTAVGDPVELGALGAVLGQGRHADRSCIIGSVKTNIGHTEAASGVAGLIKAALCLQHRAIPASLHFETPNPNIPWNNLPLTMARTLMPWPGDGVALAGVNSFGVTGTNAHIVLQEAPSVPSATVHPNPDHAQLLALSAKSPEALHALAHAVRNLVATNAPPLADMCYTSNMRRADHDHRLAIVARTHAELVEQLDAVAETHGGTISGQTGDSKVVFVFPGQGAQWPGMVRQLLQEPAFREAMVRCDRAIGAEAGWSPIEQLTAETGARLDEIDIIQPTLFAIQVSLAALWRTWGIEPAAVVGHSMGEVAAAHVAGVLSLEDAVAVICRRSRLLRRISGQGTMAAVELTLEQAQAAIAGYEDQLAIAVSNSPTSTVLSGDPTALDHVLEQLQRRDVFCRRVKVDVASHSPQVDPLRDELLSALADLQPHATATPFFSTVTARFEDGAHCDARYWERNLRQPVLFAAAVQQLLDDGQTIFVEVSPHPILLPAVENTLHHFNRQGVTVPSLRRGCDEPATMLAALGQLYTLGCHVNWQALYPAGGHVIKLPPYPWQRERFWFSDGEARSKRMTPRAQNGDPLLGAPVAFAANPDTRGWQQTFDLGDFPFLGDHCVRAEAILPATAYIELIRSAAEQIGMQGELDQLTLDQALSLSNTNARVVQTTLTPHEPGAVAFRIFSRPDGEHVEDAWTLHASGMLRSVHDQTAPNSETPEQIIARCPEAGSADDHYRTLHERALDYGLAFRVVTHVWRGEGETIAALRIPTADALTGQHAQQIVLLDGALQVAVAALSPETAGATYVPVRATSVRIYAQPTPDGELWGHAVRCDNGANTDEQVYNVWLRDSSGRVLVAYRELALRRLAMDTTIALDDWLYEVRWEDQPRTMRTRTDPGNWLVFAADSFGDEIARHLRNSGEHVVLATPGATFQEIEAGQYQLDPSDADSYRRLLDEALDPGAGPYRGIVHAWSAAMPEDDPLAAQALGVGSAVLLTQAIGEADWSAPPRLWMVTFGAQAVLPGEHGAPAQAPLWGLGRVIANEQANLRCTLVDATRDAATALVTEIVSGATDDQVALRGERRLVARLAHHIPTVPSEPALAAPGTPYRLVAATPGRLDSLAFQAVPRRAPEQDEIEIAIDAAGLNFLDVMKALGICPGFPASPEVALGGECAGTVVAVGAGVTSVAVGDQVVALTPSFGRASCFASHITLPAILATRRPANIAIEAAAGIPIIFVTAYYALHTLGRMRRGEKVLIHAAAGGVGLAAVQLAQRAGVEVFATAGSEEKRALLHSLGVEHVFDSRTLGFAEEIRAVTNGRGVDLVLNSLAGEAIPRSLACLAPRGRFLEIGKRDIYDNTAIGLEPFKRNLSLFAIDLASMVEQDPAYVAELFHEVMALFATGELQPIATHAYPIGDVAEAFRAMAQAQHTGKIVATVRDQQPDVHAASSLFLSDATYLITGGLGALGLACAERLTERGARHLMLMGRSAPSTSALTTIKRLEQTGAKVAIGCGDVAQARDVAHVLAQIDATMPPLRGVIHAAGVLADTTIAQMNRAKLEAVLLPKVAGAWNLHQLTLERQLDHFVMFSSVVALLGSPGQANYAAGNAFLDTLAHARRATGLPALSIAWGPWADIGLAAAQVDRGARLALRGVGSIAPHAGLATLERLMAGSADAVAVMPFDARQWCEAYPNAASSTLLAGLHGDTPPVGREPEFRAALLAAEPGKRRRSLLETHLREQFAQVLRLPAARIDIGKSLKAMGLDSLMAIEFKNRLESGLGLALSATLAWNYPTIVLLADYLASRMEIPLDAPTVPSETSAVPAAAEALDDLTSDELAALLSDELAAVDALLKDG